MQKLHQVGFTLVELMIAIALGLIIVAAATQLFMSGLYSVNLQKAMADIQDSSNFGVNYISSDLRKINFNADKPQITSQTNYGGIVLSDKNFPSDLSAKPATTLLSKAEQENTTGKLTNLASDQLTVQFFTDTETFDCEGNTISAGSIIVQRYFIESGQLRCDAGHYSKSKPTTKDADGNVAPYTLTGLGVRAQVVMQNVEYMRILLAVSDDKLTTDNIANDPIPANNIVQKNFRYMAIDDYPATAPFPNIRGIQIGLLVRANDSVKASTELKDKNAATFNVLDKEITLETKDSKYLRQVITQTIALRNAMGASS